MEGEAVDLGRECEGILVDDPEVEAVAVVVPPTLHLDIASAVAERGKALLQIAVDEGERYRVAHEAASRYAASLEERHVESGRLDELWAELRREVRAMEELPGVPSAVPTPSRMRSKTSSCVLGSSIRSGGHECRWANVSALSLVAHQKEGTLRGWQADLRPTANGQPLTANR